MNELPVEHPAADRLAAFGLGKLNPHEQTAVELHVSRCGTCCLRLRDLPDDHLATLAREALVTSPAPPGLPARGGRAPAASSVPPKVPAELVAHPRYQAEEVLGAGGMGVVFKARHRLMGRPVALKVVNPALLHRPAAVERFQRELRAAAQLSHHHIVTTFDAEEVGGVHFLVMEFIEGASLDRLVAEGGPLPVPLACDCVRQAALGLQHAHERGMVHRDIKPHNLMRTPGGQVKILDFGLARFLSEIEPAGPTPVPQAPQAQAPGEGMFAGPGKVPPPEGRLPTTCAEATDPWGPAPCPLGPLTGAGTVLGSPDYIAPEQLRDAHTADIRADVYSLGCTLYHLLAGRAPFQGTAAQKLRAHERERPRPLAEVRADVPAELEAVLHRMMAKDPGQRYQTPAEVAAALAPFAATPRRRRRRWAAVAAIALLAGGLALVRIVTNRGEMVTGAHELRAPEVRRFRGHPGGEGVWGAAFAPDGARAVSCGADGYVRQWDVASGKELWACDCRTGGRLLRDVAVSPDGRTALVAVYDNTVRVLDTATGRELRRFEGHRTKVHGVSFSSDGRLALSAGGTSHADRDPDNTIRLWETATGKEIRRFEGHSGWVRTSVFSPDDRHVLSASLDGTVRLWDARTGEEVRRFVGHGEGVLGAVFSPDGRQALSASWDRTARLWDVATGKELRRFEGHADTVESVAFSGDGRRALSAGNDGTVRLWDVATGKELLRAEGHAGAVRAAAFAPDGKHALSGGADGTLRLWRLPDPGTPAR